MDLQKLREWWRRQSNFLRLKVHEDQSGGPKMHDMGRLLLKEMSSETSTPPQVLQGMWQAYGQMRAARTTARATIIATGILGAGLFAYQQKLKEKAEEKTKELEEREKDLLKEKQELIKSTNIAEGIQEEVEAHRAVLDEICKENGPSSDECGRVKKLFTQALSKIREEKVTSFSNDNFQPKVRR